MGAKVEPSLTMADMLNTEDMLTGTTEAAAVTVNAIVVVRIKLPDVPVIVTVDISDYRRTRRRQCHQTVPATLPALNAAVTPLGRPDAARLTLPLKPFCALPVIVLRRCCLG
jgi:hypothetical protein